MNSVKISLIKTITWRLIGSTSTLLISYIVTSSLTIAASVFSMQLLINTILYFIHERLWEVINRKYNERNFKKS